MKIYNSQKDASATLSMTGGIVGMTSAVIKLEAIMDIKSVLQIVFGFFGGLAVFIYGMNMMSESLQKVAGNRMKSVLQVLTKNPVMGVLAGALVTAVLQSSSATTVLIIGFVSAKLMTLPQAISVILGANIGTTMTAQLIAFKISDYIWPIVFVGFIIYFLARNEKVKNVGMTIFSFGLLFVGIETMGAMMKPLAKSPVFVQLMAKVSDIPVLGVLLGTGMTLLVQSSSATIAVLQNFASQPGIDGVSSAIGLAGAIPILLGDNIGTTITALMASIGGSRDAKRAAVAHSVFNVSGSFVFIWLITPFAKFVQFISPKGPELSIISRQIANAHMSFNILNTLIWLPLIPLMVKIVTTIVRTQTVEKEQDENRVKFLDRNVLAQPMAAIFLISKEINRASDFTARMLNGLRKAFVKNDSASLEKVQRNGAIVQTINQETVSYISSLFSLGGLTEEQSAQTAGLMYVLNDIARIAERCLDILPVARRSVEKKYKFSEDAIKELNESFEFVSDIFANSILALDSGSKEAAKKILEDKTELHSIEKKFGKNHLKRLKKKNCKPEFTTPFTSVLHNIDRIGNGCGSIAEEVLNNVRLVNYAG